MVHWYGLKNENFEWKIFCREKSRRIDRARAPAKKFSKKVEKFFFQKKTLFRKIDFAKKKFFRENQFREKKLQKQPKH